MTLPNYAEHEEEFLKAMATRYQFAGKTYLVFMERFRDKNSNALDKDIAQYLEVELLEGTNEGANPATIMRDRLKVICQKFAEAGCDFNGNSDKGRWKIAKCWLREVVYPEWLKNHPLVPLTCEQLWQQLWHKATENRQLKLLVPQLEGLEMGTAEMTESDLLAVRLGSRVKLEVSLDRDGYLLVLEKGTSGKIWCLSPSGFAPEPYVSGGRVILPMRGSRHQSFHITGKTGEEEIVAVIAKTIPLLDWLPNKGDPLLQVGVEHLQGLFGYLRQHPDCLLLRMAYRVVAA